MIRSILSLVVIGLLGMMVISAIFGLLIPLIALAIKVALVLLFGYLILRLISPKKAEEVRSRLRRVK
ncbi:MAG: hypothetical protein ACE5JR_07895 [Gemmatimonadota bacterium]